jgi:hypothetical protein
MPELTQSFGKSAPSSRPRERAVAEAPSRVAWGHVALFAFLSYAIAWALILPFIPNVFDLIRADETPAELDISIVPVFAMFAPLAAALVTRLFVRKERTQRVAGSAAQVAFLRTRAGASRRARQSHHWDHRRHRLGELHVG